MGNKRKYPWPASALTKNEMKILHDLRELTGAPITKVLKWEVEQIGKNITNAQI